MRIIEVVETDLITKAFAIAPTVSNPDEIPTTVAIANAFGGVSMKIKAELNPIELMFMVETEHQLNWDGEHWILDLHMMDIVNHVPSTFLMGAYDPNMGITDVLQDADSLTMLGNSFSAEATMRFRNNRYVNEFIGFATEGVFDGWTLHTISIDGTGKSITPTTPVSRLQNELQLGFEQTINNLTYRSIVHDDTEIVINGVFTKRISYPEFEAMVRSKATDPNFDVEIKNINYSLFEMIGRGYIPEDLYEVTKQKRVNGTTFDNYEFDLEPVLNIIREKVMLPVVIVSRTTYTVHPGDGDQVPMLGIQFHTPFDKYVNMIMYDNILAAAKDSIRSFGQIIKEKAPAEEPEPDDPASEESVTDEIDDDLDFADDLLASVLEEDESEEEEQDAVEEETEEEPEEVEVSEVVKEEVEPERPTQTMEFAFFVFNASFNDIRKIESNPDYHDPSTKGVICMDLDENGIPQTYYLGTIAPSENSLVRFKWDTIDHDKLFRSKDGTQNIVYKVRDWYKDDKTCVHNVLWVDYHKWEIGGEQDESEQ